MRVLLGEKCSSQINLHVKKADFYNTNEPFTYNSSFPDLISPLNQLVVEAGICSNGFKTT